MLRTRVIESCFFHSVTTNGPVPTGVAQFSSCVRCNALGDSIATQGWLSESSSEESGVLRMSWMSLSLTTLVSATFAEGEVTGGGSGLRVLHVLDVRLDGGGVQRCAVGEVHAVAQREVPGQAVVADLPLLASQGMISPLSSLETSDSRYWVPTRACG